MATILNVKTSDSEGHSVTYNIDNPKNIPDPLTRASISAAFQYGIDNNILMSNYGVPIQNIDQIAYTSTEKIIVQGEPVYISPNSISLTISYAYQTVSTTVTVSNAQVQAATIILDQPDDPLVSIETVINNNPIQNTGTITINAVPLQGAGTGQLITYTGKLRIVITGKNYSIPTTIIWKEP